jgi:chromatin remodeling complex protein RSC6
MNNDDFSTATQRADAFEKAHFKCNKALGLSLAISARYEEAFEAVKDQPPAERMQYMKQLAELLGQEVKASGDAIMAIGEYVLAADNAPSWITQGLESSIERMRSAFFSMRETRNKFLAKL